MPWDARVLEDFVEVSLNDNAVVFKYVNVVIESDHKHV